MECGFHRDFAERGIDSCPQSSECILIQSCHIHDPNWLERRNLFLMPSKELSQPTSGVNRKRYKLYTHARCRCYPSYHSLFYFNFPSVALDVQSQPDLAVDWQRMVILNEGAGHGQIANLRL